eukprot:g17397.t1
MQSQKTAGSTSRKPNALSESQKRQRFQADSCSSGSGNENDRINKKKKTAQEQQKVNAPVNYQDKLHEETCVHPMRKGSIGYGREKSGATAGVVNPGNRFTPGGGFATGGRHALEEALCTQSTLYPALVHAHKQFRQNNRPFGHYEVIVTPRVEFFRFGNEYLFSAHTRSVTVLTMPMYNKNHRVHGQPVDAPKGEKEYIGGVERKFRSLFHAAEEAGVGRLLLCDIGCGVYQNDPRVVGRCLGRVMAELPFGSVKEVVVSGDRRFFQAANSALLRLSKL